MKSGQEVQPKTNNQIYFERLRDIIIITSSGGPPLKIEKTSKHWYIYVHEVCGEHSPDNSRWLGDWSLGSKRVKLFRPHAPDAASLQAQELTCAEPMQRSQKGLFVGLKGA